MTGFLLDTNVISELIKPRPDAHVAAWVESTDENAMFLSVLTLGEIRKGLTAVADASRRITLETWLDRDLSFRFARRILPIDAEVADRWGRICGSPAVRKSPVPVIDSWLAATALHHDLIVVTRDTGPASICGSSVFNPWKS